MRYAVLEQNIVVNIAEAEADFADEMGWVELGEGKIGDTYDPQSGTLISPSPPPPIVPVSVSMRQARLALLGAGLLAQVDAALDGMGEPDRTAALIEWEYATELRRNHPLVVGLTAALELTEEQVDALFIAASQIA